MFTDNLMNEAMISTWIKDEFESNKDVIEDLSAAQVSHVLENEQFVMVYVCEYYKNMILMAYYASSAWRGKSIILISFIL